MTSIRSRKQVPVGSAQWVNDENEQVAQFCTQEAEDFAFSARNEIEWLNEHMADVLSKNHKDITECFKTPGKLRGKTPRTARKRNPLEAREPLSDIFSVNARPNSNSPQKASPSKPPPTFKVAEDLAILDLEKKTTKTTTDSGYHGLPEDDMEVDELPTVPHSSAQTTDTVGMFLTSPLREQPIALNEAEGRSTTDRSFQSAREEFTEKVALEGSKHEEVEIGKLEVVSTSEERLPIESVAIADTQAYTEPTDLDGIDKDLEEALVVDASRSPSQGSSPPRPLARKSSLTFAPLPPRDFSTKMSIGARASQAGHSEFSKGTASRGSFLDQITGGKSIGWSKQPEQVHEKKTQGERDFEMERPGINHEASDTDSKMTKLHNQSSTQRLHDKINKLGERSQPARPTKSIPAATAAVNPSYPDLPKEEPHAQHLQDLTGTAVKVVALQASQEDDDDWIKPPQQGQNSPSRPRLPKSFTADVMEDIVGKHTVGGETFGRSKNILQDVNQQAPVRQASNEAVQAYKASPHKKAAVAQSTSPMMAGAQAESEIQEPDPSTTPISSSASKRYADGPLSASKSKLQSIMKTARGLFSSSAGISAQAKMETLSPNSMRVSSGLQDPSIEAALNKKTLHKSRPQSPAPNPGGRKTRSSTEKEVKREKSSLQAREQAERERREEKETMAVVISNQAKGSRSDSIHNHAKSTRQSPRTAQTQEVPNDEGDTAEEVAQAPTTNPSLNHAQSLKPQPQRLKDVRRVQKPAKEAAPKTKPPPVAIKVALSQGMRVNSALSTGLQDSLPQAPSKQPTVAKKPSNSSLHPAISNSSLKNSVSAATKPRALLAAERKKEQDEKEAQRKLEQKREIERKRAAQQEEARKQEQLQRQEAERQRERERSAAVEDPKLLAKKQAIEKRRMEMKKDQPRAQRRHVPDSAPSTQQAQSVTSRPELGGQRPPSRLHNMPDNSRLAGNQSLQNPVKPAIKRVFDPDADEEPFRPARVQGGITYQANDDKRRRTENEEVEEVRVRPTMAPPIRQSGIRQGALKSSILNSSYTTAPPPAPHHRNQPSLLKTTTANQAYQQHTYQSQAPRPGHHPDIAKYQNGKIPFADNPNPPPPPHPSQPYKTPLPSSNRPNPHPQSAKSPPCYPNGDNIHLDDIPTESEDESSDDDSSNRKKPPAANSTLPEWAQSPQLRELLMTQDENMDADAVFGPVQSPHMEEMFRERQHRFRNRTSSANWAGQDRLTEEEIRRDVEARKRLRREGGWTFGL